MKIPNAEDCIHRIVCKGCHDNPCCPTECFWFEERIAEFKNPFMVMVEVPEPDYELVNNGQS